MGILIEPEEAERLVREYSDLILRLGYTWLKSTQDAEDICQNVLLSLVEKRNYPTSPEEERAWIIRMAINACKNLRRSAWRSRTVGLDTVAEQAAFQPDPGGVLETVQALPLKYREVTALYYFIGYDTNEIASLLHITPAAVRKRLSRARDILREQLKEENL